MYWVFVGKTHLVFGKLFLILATGGFEYPKKIKKHQTIFGIWVFGALGGKLFARDEFSINGFARGGLIEIKSSKNLNVFLAFGVLVVDGKPLATRGFSINPKRVGRLILGGWAFLGKIIDWSIFLKLSDIPGGRVKGKNSKARIFGLLGFLGCVLAHFDL